MFHTATPEDILKGVRKIVPEKTTDVTFDGNAQLWQEILVPIVAHNKLLRTLSQPTQIRERVLSQLQQVNLDDACAKNPFFVAADAARQ